MSDMNFDGWFNKLTGHPAPRDWQKDLASESNCRDRLIRIPTGLGKTEGVLASWSFHRIHRGDERWPLRLVWCLPMRVLVEQTQQVAKKLMEVLPQEQKPSVHVIMGGEGGEEWYLHPEKPAIIIGTQDMLLSRAMNRGYASPRARWPMEFGQLSHDALWVMDEVQLMDVGLATSAQLQAFRQEDREKKLRSCHTWWMSATLQPDWLRSVDTEPHVAEWFDSPCVVPQEKRQGGPWEIKKHLEKEILEEDEAFAQRILSEHAKVSQGEFGKITLVVCNTVKRACDVFDLLKVQGRNDGLELVHSRFRPAEREGWREKFLSRESCAEGTDRIIVATQVVEAGVDISAGCLITELAPWSSLVQRFGRCARYGGEGKVIVANRGIDEAAAAPYAPEELESSWHALQSLSDVGIGALESYEEQLSDLDRKRLYPYAPAHLILRKEFDELFDTTPDLTGADLDISRFIRSGEERDLQVFWLDLEKDEAPDPKRKPHRRELCSVPFLKARDWLCGKETKTNRKPKLSGGMRAWVWDWIEGEWVLATREALFPGRIVCVASSCGGYRVERGFDEASKREVPAVKEILIPKEVDALNEADDQQDSEDLSITQSWKTIGFHGAEVADQVLEISRGLVNAREIVNALELAAIWHDWGKAHPAFQGAMGASPADRPQRQDLAKAPQSAWRKPPARMYRYLDGKEMRPAFRHELASALGLFAILKKYAPEHPALLGPWIEVFKELGRAVALEKSPEPPSAIVQRILDCSPEEFDLVAYLVMSHHGKVRLGLHASPKDQDYRDRDGRGLPIRGVRDGDRLPSVLLDDQDVPEIELALSPAELGLSPITGISWRERCDGLLRRFGPSALAYLEGLLRSADVRASRLKTSDPAFVGEAKV